MLPTFQQRRMSQLQQPNMQRRMSQSVPNLQNLLLGDDKKHSLLRIRAELGSLLPEELNNDLYLMRWMNAWNGDVEQILVKLRQYLQNRRAMKFDRAEFLENYLKHQNPEFLKYASVWPASTSYPLNKIDESSIVWLDPTGRADLANIVKIGKFSDFLKFMSIRNEYVQLHALSLEKKLRRPIGVISLHDLEGFMVSPSLFNLLKETSIFLADNYPETVVKMIVIKQPSFFDFLYNKVFKVFLPKKTEEKVHFLSMESWKEELLEIIDSSCLPEVYGGTKKDYLAPCEPETGCPPKPVKIGENNFYKTPIDRFRLSICYLRPRQIVAAQFDVDTPNAYKLRWCFKANGILRFKISFTDSESVMAHPDDDDYDKKEISNKEELVFPDFPVLTNFVPEDGELVCERSGIYAFHFRNTGSYLFSTKLEYCLQIVSATANFHGRDAAVVKELMLV